jgi:hypothetical protein
MANNRFYISNDLHEMTAAKAGSATPRVIFKSDDGILIAYGTTVPADAATGYAPGCLFIHVDGGVGTMLYCNEGSLTSADFDAVTVG